MRYFLVNWKMYLTVDEGRTLLEAVQAGLSERASAGAALPRVIVCPDFVSLAPLQAVADGRLVSLGAQNCHWESEGPYTGEISARMLEGFVEYVLVGHSERRVAGETDEQIGQKVAAIARSSLIPILFVGEDAPSDEALTVTEQRLRRGLAGIDASRQEVLVVYEPSWAIGARQAAPPEHVRRSVQHLKDVLTELGAKRPEIVYGGTVTPDAVDDLARLGVLDGVGATRASLQAESFLAIVDRVARWGGAGADPPSSA